jgi:hypothetical protein
MSLRRLTLAIVSLAIGCSDRNPTQPAPLIDAAVTGPTEPTALPFRATFSGNANPEPTSNPCILDNPETGNGTAEHLGTFTWSDEETVDLCVVSGHGIVTGHFVLTAANGDQIEGQHHTDVQFGLNSVSGTGRYQLTGGTGRFQDVSGSGTVEVAGTVAPPATFKASLSGTIRF